MPAEDHPAATVDAGRERDARPFFCSRCQKRVFSARRMIGYHLIY